MTVTTSKAVDLGVIFSPGISGVASLLLPAFEEWVDEAVDIFQDTWPRKSGDSYDAWDGVAVLTNTGITVNIINYAETKYGKNYAGFVYRKGMANNDDNRVWRQRYDVMVDEAVPQLLQDCLTILMDEKGG